MRDDDETPNVAPIPKWFVAFMGAETNFILDRVSPKGFRHIVTFAFDPRAEAWIVYDVSHKGTIIFALLSEDFDHYLSVIKRAGATILEIDTRPSRDFWRLQFYCVNAVKHLTGVRSRAMRPIGLYRDMLKHGARPAFRETVMSFVAADEEDFPDG